MKKSLKYLAVVVGASAGGTRAISGILAGLPRNIAFPIIIAQHRAIDEKSLLEENLQKKISVKVKQADEKEGISRGFVYIAPPGYHLLVERDQTFSLSCDPPVRFSRPSIDVLFETASEVYKEGLVAIILTGANDDGASGITSVLKFGGLTIAQDPEEAHFPAMPKAAIETGAVRRVFTLKEINKFLIEIVKNGESEEQP